MEPEKNGLQAFYQSIKERGWEKAFKKPADLVLAAGGDGTVHTTAWQLMGSRIPLAILPFGTANNLARSLGFTESVDEILQSIHCGKIQPFDVGVARNGSERDYFRYLVAPREAGRVKTRLIKNFSLRLKPLRTR